ncbi:MAG: hypothetical protein BGN92_03865 [Sphingobacteriales bacterium 41-5]|nr:MAG: hypothetical protein BGN92_03865 [Sphingobacteriales bacterium 41-5]
MNFLHLILLCILSLITSYGFGQHIISGRIYQSNNPDRPLQGAQISVGNNRAISEADGTFYMGVANLPATLTFMHVSYNTKTLDLKNGDRLDDINVIMSEKYSSLDQIVVTAGRFPQRRRDIPQKMEVISEADINATTSLDMTDILKKNTTVNVIQYPGLLSGIGIRGFRPQFSGLNQRTLLLVNGRPAGATNMGFLDANNAERVEVLKGPASALYGSQAMGGVVNIITPQSTCDIGGRMNVSYGSFNTYIFSGKIGGDISRKFDFDVAASLYKRANNVSLGNGNLFRNLLLGADSAKQVYSIRRNGNLVDSIGYTPDTTGDGQIRPYTKYRYHTTGARLGYKITNNWRMDLSGSSFTAKNVESPGEIFKEDRDAGLKNVYRYSGDLTLSGNIQNHELMFRGYGSSERSDAIAIRNATGKLIDTPYIARRSGYSWRGFQAKDAMQIGEQKIIFGYDYNYAFGKLIIFPVPADKQRNEYTTAPNSSLVTHGIYTQAQLSFLERTLRVNPGVRFDNTTFNILETPGFSNTLKTGKQSNLFFSPSIAAQYDITKTLVVRGSIGRAFVTPDASNIAGTTILGKGTGKITMTNGNPDLKNESSWSQDIGLRFAKRGWYADVSYFATQVKDRITPKAAPPAQPTVVDGDNVTAITTYFNSDNSYIKGLEIIASYDFGILANHRYNLRPFLNLTRYFRYEDTKQNASSAVEKTIMNNIAKNNYLFGIDYTYKHLNAKLSSRYVSHRWDRNYNDALRPLIEYPPFMTMDFFVAYKLSPMHQLAFYLDNITDENYYEKRGYNLPGRNFRLKYTFEF